MDFCKICGLRLAHGHSSAVCQHCQLQKQGQKQKVLLAAGLISVFLIVLTTFLAWSLLLGASHTARRKQAVEQARFERIYRDFSNKRQQRGNSETSTDEVNTRIHELNQYGERLAKQKRGNEPDFGPYIAELQRRIRKRWKPPGFNKNRHIVVTFRITRAGSLMNTVILQSSGSREADSAALEAIRLSAPFRSFPANYRGKDIPVQFTFDYELSKRLDKRKSKLLY